MNIYTYVILFSTGSEHKWRSKRWRICRRWRGWEEVGPSQLKKRKIKRGSKIVELCQNRTLVEEIFVKKTMCTQYNQYFNISHNIFNDAGHFCEISDNFVKRNVQRVRNWYKRQSKNKCSFPYTWNSLPESFQTNIM